MKAFVAFSLAAFLSTTIPVWALAVVEVAAPELQAAMVRHGHGCHYKSLCAGRTGNTGRSRALKRKVESRITIFFA
ncbi:MAG: hypothetical protein JO308_17590 [Verrucomicrobia bacterium]|nr:hypothetical protein [Verrucomicrobiota bacterium]